MFVLFNVARILVKILTISIICLFIYIEITLLVNIELEYSNNFLSVEKSIFSLVYKD